jgi:hypothetical protein
LGIDETEKPAKRFSCCMTKIPGSLKMKVISPFIEVPRSILTIFVGVSLHQLIMSEGNQNIIIYNTPDGKASVSLFAKDGSVWMNQSQLAELFDTSKQNIGQHVINILNENELDQISVIKNFFTTASDGKDYKVTFYALDMILAIGFRVRSRRGTQFRIQVN